jgi:thiol-disulfide isomerase/thioredoxin
MPFVTRRQVLGVMQPFAAVALLVGVLWTGLRSEPTSVTAVKTTLDIEGELPSLRGANAWLNSPPLSAQGLHGKVVLVQFWTYTCINWRRTLPYVRAWAEKYQSQEFVVIGVHTPEFSFESDHENVRAATAELGITYPLAIDSDYAIWQAFGNQYWPALYLADAQGRIRYHQFGEGDYANTEVADLLRQRRSGRVRGLQGGRPCLATDAAIRSFATAGTRTTSSCCASGGTSLID